MKKALSMFLCLAFLLGVTGCSGEEVDPSKVYDVYYIGSLETKVEIRQYVMESETVEGQVEELLAALAATPEKLEYKAPLDMGFEILDYSVEDGKLRLNVSESYKDLITTTEVLVRAAIVKTLTQLNGINFVGFTVNGSPLYDRRDNLVGWMSSEQFIYNDGNEINTYEEVRLTLYYANETGNALIAVMPTKFYNSNISLEKLVVEALIKGPESGQEGAYPTINPDTRIIGVTVKDGICYVNLDDGFLTQPYNVTADVTIYSIVNSLAELSNVNKVQFTINGSSTVSYREKYSFATVFERNLDLVLTP